MTVADAEKPNQADAGHLPALDGFRGIAILLVMLHHFSLQLGGPLPDRIYFAIVKFGWSGVDMFFVLSGFLITGILLDSRESPSYFKSFYMRRILRIFPLYYATLLLSFLVLPRFADVILPGFEPWWYVFYLQNITFVVSGSFHKTFDVSWSLAIEEQFYLFWPLIVRFTPRNRLLSACVALILIAIVSRAALVGARSDAVYVLTPCRLDALGLGATLAVLMRSGPRTVAALKRLALPVGLLAALSFAAFSVWSMSHHLTKPGATIFGYFALDLFFASALVAALTRVRAARALGHSWLRVFGKYSYCLYLVHFPALYLIRKFLYGPEQFWSVRGSKLPGQLLFVVICTLVSLAVAHLSWVAFESPFLRLKRHFTVVKAHASVFLSRSHGTDPS